MKSIKLKNLRALKDTGTMEIRPITVLVGENSSGKSTFLRSFPLIKQSVETRTKGPILWYGRFTDFGSFDDAVNAGAEKKEIMFEFQFELNENYALLESINPLYKVDCTVSLVIGKSDRNNENTINELNYILYGHKINFVYKGNDLLDLKVNGKRYPALVDKLILLQGEDLIPELFLNQIMPNGNGHYARILSISYNLFSTIASKIDPIIDDDIIIQILPRIILSDSATMLISMQKVQVSEVWNKRVESWTVESEEFKEVRDAYIASILPWLIELTNRCISDYYKSTYYFAPIRASAERYYRVQDLTVDEVDFQGRNLAMVLKSLNDSERENFEKWSMENFGFSPVAFLSGEHVAIKIKTIDSDRETNLADTGFGYSQMLPIITELWRQINSEKREKACTFAIEQPELHLRPSLQAKLVDAFIRAIEIAKENKINLKIITETHSETIVNRLGHKVYRKHIDKDSILVYIFEKEKAGLETKVTKGYYDEKGFLLNWPFGFFEPEDIR